MGEIPVYQAIELKKVLQEGGSTKPWLVEVLIEERTEPFVVKMFKKESLDQYNAFANEVLAHELALELDLNVPDKAFIKIDDNFIDTLPTEQKKLITEGFYDDRVKFATKYIEKSTIYSPEINKKALDIYDIESIYAFDNLICNGDRRIKKPNLLLKEKDYFLIDHELSFNGISETYIKSIKNQQFHYPHEKHVFYSYLKKQKNKNNFFDTFTENFKYLDVDCLDDSIQQLNTHRHYVRESDFYKTYLRFIRENLTLFVKLLKAQLS